MVQGEIFVEKVCTIVEGDPGSEDLRLLLLQNRELDSNNVTLNAKGQNRHLKRKSSGLWPSGTEALIFVQRAVYKL